MEMIKQFFTDFGGRFNAFDPKYIELVQVISAAFGFIALFLFVWSAIILQIWGKDNEVRGKSMRSMAIMGGIMLVALFINISFWLIGK